LREVEEEVGELRQVFFSLLALLVQKYALGREEEDAERVKYADVC
jgi:hypothetical protein